MRVGAWMSESPAVVSPGTRVLEARELMVRRGIRHLPVLADGHLVGIITDRDIRLTLPPSLFSVTLWEINARLARLLVGEVMTRRVISVGPDHRIEEAARLMLDRGVGALPVVQHGRLIGIITETDLVRAFLHARHLAPRAGAFPAEPGHAVPPAPRRPSGATVRGGLCGAILVPLDGSPEAEEALPLAAGLAGAGREVLRLLRVVPEPVAMVSEPCVTASAERERGRLCRAAEAYLRGVAARLTGLPVELVVRVGDPAEAIIEEVRDGSADLVVLATRRRADPVRPPLGSVAAAVLRRSEVPVILTRPGLPAAA